jgi:hypothetical protein
MMDINLEDTPRSILWTFQKGLTSNMGTTMLHIACHEVAEALPE